MNLNLKNLGPLGFKGGLMTGKRDIGLLWKMVGDQVIFTSGYTPNKVGLFSLTPKQAEKFRKGELSLVPEGITVSPCSRNSITKYKLLHYGPVKNTRHLMSIINRSVKEPVPIPKETPRTLEASWGCDSAGETPDIVVCWGEGCRKGDAGFLANALTGQRYLPSLMEDRRYEVAPSIVAELTKRGYDIKTLRFSIQLSKSDQND